MIVRIGFEDGLSVVIDTDDDRGYSPDLCDDICARARALFRDAVADTEVSAVGEGEE